MNEFLFNNSVNLSLQDIGQRLASPCGIENIMTANQAGIKYLPPLPTALIMVLIGFMCITLVKDRKFWLACLFLLVWPVYAFLNTLPGRSATAQKQNSLSSAMQSRCRIYFLNSLSSLPTGFKLSNISLQHAVIEPPCLKPAVNCFYIRAENYSIFQPAFTFGNLSRSPPQNISKSNF